MLQTIRTKLQRLGRDTRGNVLLMAAAGMTGMVGAAGVGVDTVQWYLWKRQLQQAVDSGALAGALSATQGYGYDQPARDEVTRTSNQTFTVDRVSSPPQTGSFAGDTSAIEVVATTQQTLPFTGVFLANAPRITARAVATKVAAGTPCVQSLAKGGIGIDVSGSALADVDCPVSSNSNGGVSIDIGGSSKLTSDLIMSVGGINYGSENVPGDAAVVPYGLAVEDPLASRGLKAPAAPGNCHATNFKVLPSETVTLAGNKRYCNGLTLQGTAKLNGGIYIIDGGSLKINSGAVVELAGTGGVTFILTGTNKNIATVSVNGGASIDLRAPTASENATWAGILFYQDNSAEATHTFNGGAGIDMDGIIYMPTGNLGYNGSSSQSAQCLLIVTNRVSFSGTNKIKNDNDSCATDFTGSRSTAFVVRVVE